MCNSTIENFAANGLNIHCDYLKQESNVRSIFQHWDNFCPSLYTKGVNLYINWPKQLGLWFMAYFDPENRNINNIFVWGVIIWVISRWCLAFLGNHLFKTKLIVTKPITHTVSKSKLVNVKNTNHRMWWIFFFYLHCLYNGMNKKVKSKALTNCWQIFTLLCRLPGNKMLSMWSAKCKQAGNGT